MSLILSATDVAALRERHEGVTTRYSGRGMYGATCVGVVADDPILFAFDLALLVYRHDSDGDLTDIYAGELRPGDLRDELEHVGAPCSDSMGLSTIWYWTRVTVAEDVEEVDL